MERVPRFAPRLGRYIDRAVGFAHRQNSAKDQIPEICGEKLKSLIIGKSRWNKFNWRQSMLREIDNLGLRPRIVLTPDQDEKFGPGLADDIARLLRSQQQALMFRYEMSTCDGEKVPLYPERPHMKTFKWRTGLTYVPYQTCAVVTNYARPWHQLAATSRMRHYCYYTKQLRQERGLVC